MSAATDSQVHDARAGERVDRAGVRILRDYGRPGVQIGMRFNDVVVPLFDGDTGATIEDRYNRLRAQPRPGVADAVCLDMREVDPLWSDLFQHVQVQVTLPENMRLLLRPDQTTGIGGGRWYYQIECDRPDTFTGVMGTGRGGKAYLSPHATEGELVQTAWGLFQAYVLHEAREAFQWRGRRVFGPHIDPAALWEVAERTTFRS